MSHLQGIDVLPYGIDLSHKVTLRVQVRPEKVHQAAG